MPDSICFKAYTASVVRFTRLDGLGRPVYGDCSQLVSKFVSITATPEIDEGDEVSVNNSDGSACLNVAPCPTLRWYTLEFEFCEVDPELALFFNPKWRRISDILGSTVGWAEGSDFSCDAGFAAEIFLNAQTSQTVTEPGAEGLWLELLFPWMSNGAIGGDLTISNENINFTFTAKSRLGNAWRHGPYNVQRDETGAPRPLLVAMDPQEHVAKFLTTVRPPDAVCGCLPLDQPPLTLETTEDTSAPATVILDALSVYAANVVWEDGGTPQLVTSWPATHAYTSPGAKDIVVTDSADATRTAMITVTVLAAPAGLTVGTPTATTIPLTWTAVTDATAYEIEYRVVGATAWTRFAPNPTGTAATLTGLTADTDYEIHIRAIGDGEDVIGSLYSTPPTTGSTTA